MTRMSQLEQLLGYLERPGVTEVVLAVGEPIAMRNASGMTNITGRVLGLSRRLLGMEALLRGGLLTGLVCGGLLGGLLCGLLGGLLCGLLHSNGVAHSIIRHNRDGVLATSCHHNHQTHRNGDKDP